ncbi:MAG: RNA methyltransferase [Pseudomonadota bacterium]
MKIILSKPQLGQNIGATARIMKNFGLSNLIVVAPRDDWPNNDARQMAAGGVDVIDQAVVLKTEAEALTNINLAFALTVRTRNITKQVITIKDAITMVKALEAKGQSAAMVFGSERSGLTNEVISLCDYIITIPTNPEYGSLNLAQAAALVVYEYACTCFSKFDENLNVKSVAAKGKIVNLYHQLMIALESTDFFNKSQNNNVLQVKLLNILINAKFTESDINILHGVIKSLNRKR